ncbi:ATP-dependent RNA helicase DRS1, partial [Trichinella spiralis]|uniref:ATP-dependent RNA helicase DRS1 n=1 Tax=Trichinella spiralis TaxID=6334 RepID=UPI0001EFC97B
MDRKVSTNLTVPIHCKKKQNGNAQSVNYHPVTKNHNLKIEKSRKKNWKKETSAHQGKELEMKEKDLEKK